jgi:predicted transposase YdaD
MPTYNELVMENKVLGREYKRGLLEGELKGELKGKLEGKLEGMLEGELIVVRRQIEKRFGALPDWAAEQLGSQSTADLESLSLRLLDARSLEELLG